MGIVLILGIAGILSNKRWFRSHFFLESTVSIPSGCMDVDTFAWGDMHESKRLCVNSFQLDRYEASWKVYAKQTKTEISQQLQYQDSSGNPILIDGAPDLPITGLTWKEADKYCRDRSMRLPSFDEWEYVARSGISTVSITDPKTVKANLNGEFQDDVYPAISPVGSFPANTFGVHDMIGNTEEWTSTCHDEFGKIISPDSVRQADWRADIVCISGGGAWNTSRSWFSQGSQERPFGHNPSSLGVRCAK